MTLASIGLQSEIKADLEPQLFDAQSARFIWPEKKHDKIYCGFVNAKNRLGAYVGYRQFLAFTDGGVVSRVRIDEPDDLIIIDGKRLVPAFCGRAGYQSEPSS